MTLDQQIASPWDQTTTVDRCLRTGAWYGDAPLHLDFPAAWNVIFHWPRTPPPLTQAQIRDSFEHPVGQRPFRELCKGKSRPVVLVDDVNRPTPTARVLPVLLKEFEDAGISPSKVTVIIARGSHGAPRQESMLLKVGPEVASSCRVVLHDPYRHTAKVGRTSFGTPVYVNKEVLGADFVVGIGGVYPNNTAGFGGGAKLALGVLDIRVISHLHSKHTGVGWGSAAAKNTFRKDIEEIARMIGLDSLLTCHVDANRELVRLTCGDYGLYYKKEVDLSLTFIHMKGVYPLRHASPGASRIVLGACSEGEGFHGVYPIVRMPILHEQRDRLRRISLMTPAEMTRKLFTKIASKFVETPPSSRLTERETKPNPEPSSVQRRNPIWLYRTLSHQNALPSPVRGIRTVSSWNEILGIIRAEQGGRDALNVAVYPCAPLQVLE